jgi:hypothetical protein
VSLALVVALAPTPVVWQSPIHGEHGRPVGVNKWSWQDESLPGAPYVDRTRWTIPPITTALDSQQASLAAYRGDIDDVVIRVENFDGELIVSSCGADQVWQAELFCRDVVRRRTRRGLDTLHVHDPDACHRAILPGETAPVLRPDMPRSGGVPPANRKHGRQVLSAIVTVTGSLGNCPNSRRHQGLQPAATSGQCPAIRTDLPCTGSPFPDRW